MNKKTEIFLRGLINPQDVSTKFYFGFHISKINSLAESLVRLCSIGPILEVIGSHLLPAESFRKRFWEMPWLPSNVDQVNLLDH